MSPFSDDMEGWLRRDGTIIVIDSLSMLSEITRISNVNEFPTAILSPTRTNSTTFDFDPNDLTEYLTTLEKLEIKPAAEKSIPEWQKIAQRKEPHRSSKKSKRR